MTRQAVVTGIGHGLPSRIMTNFDLEKIVDTTDEWITQRTGIRQRYICSTEETASTLSIKASKEALERASLAATDLDLVIVATVTGDYSFPSTSCIVQDEIGAKNAGAFDLGAACAGFIYSVSTAGALIQAGTANRILVVGVDVLSKTMDWTDRSTCVLFGDGAGAIVLEGREDTNRGLLKTRMKSDGAGSKLINIEVGGSRYPIGSPEAEGRSDKLYMAGKEVYRFAVTAMCDACLNVLSDAGMTPEDVDLFVPHQANLRIIRSAQEKLGLPDEKVFVNVERVGNTSAGSIPLALYDAVHQGKLKEGMNVLTVGFGAGLVWGANVIRW